MTVDSPRILARDDLRGPHTDNKNTAPTAPTES